MPKKNMKYYSRHNKNGIWVKKTIKSLTTFRVIRFDFFLFLRIGDFFFVTDFYI